MTVNRFARPGLFAACFLLLLAPGCKSIWASLTSPSDSVSGSSTAIGGSLGGLSDGISQSCSGTKPSSDELAYGDDVRVLTRTFLRDGAPAGAFPGAVSRVAEARGLSDWHAERTTFHAVGVALAQEGLDRGAADAWLERAGLAEPEVRRHVEEGYLAALR